MTLKRLVVAVRIKFMETRQDPNKSIIHYAHSLKEASKYFKFIKKMAGKYMTWDDN